MKNIGVLALQGSFAEHVKMLSKLENVKGVLVRKLEDFEKIDGLILPGGESTAISKLLKAYNMFDTLREKILQGLPVWGTCAGMILLAKGIVNEETVHLGVLDALVRRNAYGSQLDSFISYQRVDFISESPVKMVFIRAPYIEKVWGNAKAICEVDDNIVACRQKNILATSFHPELTDDCTFHKYFCEEMVK